MRKRFVKFFSMVTAAALLAASVAGCQNAGGQGSEAQGSQAGQKATIRYTRWGLPEEMNGTKKLITAFEEEHSNITVKLESSSWDQYWEKIQTEIASNTAPDAMLMDGGWYLSQFAPKGVLSDIGALMKKDDISKDDYFDVWKTFTYQDTVYAMPRDYNSIVLYYNKDLFKKAGVTEYPSDDMTWDQAVELGQKLTLDKNGKNATDAGFDDKNITQYGLYLPTNNVDSTIETLIWQKGGKLMSEDGTQCLIDSAESKSAFQFLYDLTYKYKVAPSASEALKYGEEAFPSGKFAMVYQGSWLQSSLTESKFEWDIAVAPTFGAQKIWCTQSVGNAILKFSSNQEAAWEFIKFMSGKEGQKIMADSHDSIPVLKDVAENYYVKLSGAPNNKQAIFDEAASSVPYVDYPQKSKIFDVVANVTPLYFNNKESLDTTVGKVKDQVENILSTGE